MSQEQIRERIEKITSAARDFCETCINIGDVNNPDYIELIKALEFGAKYANMGLTQIKRARKNNEAGDTSKMLKNVSAYVDRYIDSLVNVLIIENWYIRTHERMTSD